MSQKQLTYCCSNPECHHKFTIDQAKHADGLIQLNPTGSRTVTPGSVALVHILCPNCKNIVASIHVPADPI
jgi:hypothetical protein